MYLVNNKQLLYLSCTFKINQCLAARVVYSFILYSDLIYESTVHYSDCTASKSVKIGPSIYILHNYAEPLYISCTYRI